MPSTSTRLSPASPSADEVAARTAVLERKLVARDRTIASLVRRVEAAQSRVGTTFAMVEQNIALEQLISKRTDQIEGQKRTLERAVEELRSTQVKLVQAQKLEAIGQLAAGIAHEINTPTQYVSDNTVFLQRAFTQILVALERCAAVFTMVEAGAVEPEALAGARAALRSARIDYMAKQVPRALEQSLEGLGRVTSIVSAMKTFSHPSGGEKQLVDLADSVRTTLAVARNEWKYVAEVETDFAEDVPAVPCLRDEFNQVILNLLVNAAHAIGDVTQNGAAGLGRIVVSTRRVGDLAELRISDTGGGIPEHVRTRVFEPFFTTKAVGRGTGQGLAIAYSVVVDKHGGTIAFETELGVGTTFVIRLPLASADVGSLRSL